MLWKAMRRRGGFTMMEMLVVISIIMLLAAILLPVLQSARGRGRVVKCKENMRGLHRAIVMYRDSYLSWRDDAFPYRITKLYPKYIDYKESFVCPDDSSEGNEGGKPGGAADQYAELDEHDKPGCLPLSYMYEFSGAQCSWPWSNWVGPPDEDGNYGLTVIEIDSDNNGIASWGEVKWQQLNYGDQWLHQHLNDMSKGYPPSKFPILRCFWHTPDPDSSKDIAIINLSFMGNVFMSGAKWEETTHH